MAASCGRLGSFGVLPMNGRYPPEPCIHCGQPGYKSVLAGWLCRGHYILLLEQHLGEHAPKFASYQDAVKGDWIPIPLFEMEKA